MPIAMPSKTLGRILRLCGRGLVWLVAASSLTGCAPVAPAPPPMPMTPGAASYPTLLAEGPSPPVPHFSTVTPAPTPTPAPILLRGPLTVALGESLPESIVGPLLAALNRISRVEAANGTFPLRVLDQSTNAAVQVTVVPWRMARLPLASRAYAVVAPFATVRDDISLEELLLRWQGQDDGPLLADAEAVALLRTQLGAPAGVIATEGDLTDALAAAPGSLGIVAFDRLHPRYKVLTVDGISVLDNRFDAADYPLMVAVVLEGEAAPLLAPLLAGAVIPATNRDPARLTTLIMTGVTAITRGTAAAIERNDLLYPAAIISATLAAADITHVSNEVPFLDDCVVNNTLNNLVLCSHTDYWAVLEAIGTDIVGLSGNHVNDFGRAGARRSLQFYHDNAIPIYGSGLTPEEACAPLLWEHGGNTFAFVAALAFGPSTAWVTDEEPGACEYYSRKEELLALVTQLAAEVDIVAVELQFEESYDARPLATQVREFRDLRAAGATLVTGVQSHVPQAWEPYGSDDPGGAGMILYGLGNLFFDQMWSWETRTNLIARHTIYDGRLLSTEILTTVLEDFAQPRWTTESERGDLLRRIFNAAPARPSTTP